MNDKSKLELVFAKYGHTDFRWMDPRETVVAQWVRMKCTFGCGNYGKHACCPPNLPSVPECRQFFDEYVTGVIFHFPKRVEKPEDFSDWCRKINQDLLAMEREIFLLGYQKSFLLPMSTCRKCETCFGAPEECKNPKVARPTPEGMAVDVYATVRKYDFPIKVVADYSQTINKYAFLLIE